jgi:hypothetical protein
MYRRCHSDPRQAKVKAMHQIIGKQHHRSHLVRGEAWENFRAAVSNGRIEFWRDWFGQEP